MDNRARNLFFSGTALAIVFGALHLSDTVSRTEVATLMQRAADFATRTAGEQASRLPSLGFATVPAEETVSLEGPARSEPPLLRVSSSAPADIGLDPRMRVPAANDPAVACAELPAAPAVFGDRVKLRVFEILAPPPGAGGAEAAAWGGGFERLDITGVYDVGADGNLSLPLVGRVNAAGQDLACLEATLGSALSAGFGAGMRVSASFATRPPVILKGDIGAPGRYDASAGMNVQDLLSAAGDLRVTVPDVRHLASLDARRIEIEAALADIHIEMARLDALLEGRDDLDLSPAANDTILKTIGEDRLALEAQALAAQITERAEQRARTLRDIETQLQQVTAREENLKIITDQLAILDERHAKLEALKGRGVVAAAAVTQSDMDRMALQRTLVDVRMGLVEARAVYEQMVSAESVELAQRRSALFMELRDAARHGTALSSQLEGIEMQIGFESGTGHGDEGLTVQIERRVPNIGEMIFKADLYSEVLPGDLVNVQLGARTVLVHDSETPPAVSPTITVASK